MRTLLATMALLAVLPAAAQEVVPPRLLDFVHAPLPLGTVTRDVGVRLEIVIDATGRVTEATVLDGVGAPWDEAARDAVLAFVFEPARQGEQPISVRLRYTYRFYRQRRGRFVEAKNPRRALHPTPGYRVYGRLVEKGTRRPLPALTVRVEDPKTDAFAEATSDVDGNFTAFGLPPGRLRLVIVTGEHAPIQRRIRGIPEADPPPEDPVTLYLDPVGVSQYRTVVKAKPRAKAATQIDLDEEEVRRVPGTFGDPTRVVQSLPGVARSPFGLGYYVVRGASFENTGFFIDGHPALFLYHLLGGPGVLDPEIVGGISFYPGGYPAEYGRFATGAIVIDTKDPPSDRWHADFSIDLLKASALFSTPFDDGKGQLTFSVRKSYYELLLPLFADDFSLSYTDYHARLRYDVTRDLRLRFYALGAEDAVSQGGGSDGTDVALGFHRLLFGADWQISKTLRFENSVVWELDRTANQRTSESEDDIKADLIGYVFSLRHGLRWTLGEHLRVFGGVDALLGTLSVDLAAPSIPPLGDPRPPAFDPIIIRAQESAPIASVAPFLSVDWEIADTVRLLPGVRATMDWYGGKPHWSADPKLAVRVKVHPQWTLTGMTALAHQAPAVFQTEEPFGDPDLPPVRGLQASAGVEWEGPDGWEVKLEGFYNRLHNMARSAANLDADEDSVARDLWKADMQGRAYGAELLVRKRFGGRVHGWLSYTFSRSERLRPPADWQVFELDQTHILNAAWTVQLGADWSFGARFTLTSGNPYFPVEGSYFDADRDEYAPVFADESTRFRVFHRLDVRLDKRWRFDTWMLEGYLDIQNVYNADNPEAQRYSFDYSQRGSGASLPILPTLGVRAVF